MKKVAILSMGIFLFLSIGLYSQTYYSFLDYNNIKALIRPVGHHFWDWQGSASFQFPADSATSTIFCNTLWIGGKDSEDSLHLCGERYRQIGRDYTTGPLSYNPDLDFSPTSVINEYDYIWEITKAEIDEFILCNNNPAYPAYEIPEDILNWPAHGDVSIGQSYYLAPFLDVNGNGYYDPVNGDYPNIRGQQCLFFIYNDYKAHGETGGGMLGVEIHGMAYAYIFPDEPAYENTIFLNYKIINRSSEVYHDTYIGVFTDFDIGYPKDDYIGCDVPRGTFYAYNADDFDETAEGIAGYGADAPAQSATLLSGPYMDSDGVDNPNEDAFGEQVVDESINGMFFGDGIIDNERLGMTRFNYFNNCETGANPNTLDPYYAEDYYAYMTGSWLDGTPISYGGTGHYSGGADTLKPVRFVFPGNPNTNTYGWGVDGVPQAAWSEETEGNPPADRRGMSSSGPFTFNPGDTAYVDLAFVSGVAIGVKSSSIEVMQQYIDVIRSDFESNVLPDGSPFYITGIESSNVQTSSNLRFYPNPANNSLTVQCGTQTDFQIEILDIQGKVLLKENMNGNSHVFDISSLSEGVYFVKISDSKNSETKKLVILR